VIVPRGVPSDILARLNSELNRALQSPEVKRRIETLGGEVGGGSIEEFDRQVNGDIQRYRGLVVAHPQ
jgi:tripartite-type tricarboxylate transporter receptor subunit TctC